MDLSIHEAWMISAFFYTWIVLSLLGIWAFRDSFIGDTGDDESEFMTSLRQRFLGEVDVHIAKKCGWNRRTEEAFLGIIFLTLFRFRETAHKEVILGMLKN